VDFSIAYKAILQEHNLFATGTTGSFILEATGLQVYRFSPGPLGGEQQIGARVALNEMDLVIFLRDPLTAREYEPDMNSLLRLCDVHNIPFATNIATAEMLIKGLERGDLYWREIVNPK
jgi:methylglyoxal synthase